MSSVFLRTTSNFLWAKEVMATASKTGKGAYFRDAISQCSLFVACCIMSLPGLLLRRQITPGNDVHDPSHFHFSIHNISIL